MCSVFLKKTRVASEDCLEWPKISGRLHPLGQSNSQSWSLLGKLLIRFQNTLCFEKQIYKLSPVNYITPFVPRGLLGTPTIRLLTWNPGDSSAIYWTSPSTNMCWVLEGTPCASRCTPLVLCPSPNPWSLWVCSYLVKASFSKERNLWVGLTISETDHDSHWTFKRRFQTRSHAEKITAH